MSTLPQHHPRIAHFRPYWFNDSPAGIRRASRRGFRYVDQDAHVLADGTVVIKHWGLPSDDGFTRVQNAGGRAPDPHPQLRLAERTWEEVSRLRRRVGRTAYHQADEHMALCARSGLTMCLEAKADTAFGDPAVFERLRDQARDAGCHLVVMTLQDIGDPLARLTAAHAAGLETALLPRGHRPPDFDSAWAPHVDRVWGHWH